MFVHFDQTGATCFSNVVSNVSESLDRGNKAKIKTPTASEDPPEGIWILLGILTIFLLV